MAKMRSAAARHASFTKFLNFAFFIIGFLGYAVARGRLEPPDLRNVAIGALKSGLFSGYAFRPFLHLIFKIFIMARRTGHERHVRILHGGDIRVLRDPDVTNGAILNCMMEGLVIEPQGVTGDHVGREIRRSRAVTARAIGTNGFLSLVVAAKAGCVPLRRAFKKFRAGGKTIDGCLGQRLGAHRLPVAEFRHFGERLVTDSAVVELRRRRIVRPKCGGAKARVNKMRRNGPVRP